MHRQDRNHCFRLILGVQNTSPTDRIQIEAQAQATVEAQIYSGVRYVLNALTPPLLEILTYRPRLSLSLASQLLSMAEQHGSSVVGYATQALTTESLGLLHLITSGHPKKEANLVREAIFSGSSLPDTLLSLGITKAAHRKTIYTPNRQNALATPAETTLSDLPLSGDNWLAVMRHTKHLPLNRQEDWSDFRQLMTKLLATNIQQEKIPLKLLNVCGQPNFKESCQRLHAIVSKARLFARAANNLANMHLAVDDNMPKAIALVTKACDIHGNAPELGTSAHLDPHNFGELLFGVSQLSGKSMNQLWSTILNMHPGIPNGFNTPRGIYLQALNSIDFAQLHGIECENCLKSIPVIGQYVTKGFALYGVRNVSGAQGTIALHYDAHRVCVAEVGGINDESARPNIRQVARSLAEAWNKELRPTSWVSYANQCSEWQHLALEGFD